MSDHRHHYQPVPHVGFSMRCPVLVLTIILLPGAANVGWSQGKITGQQLDHWLKRFPAADANGDGKLSIAEAMAFRDQKRRGNAGGGAPREFPVNEGWNDERFPDHAICYKSPQEIKAIYASKTKGREPAVVSFEKPTDGALRIVGTGHSFMAPGYRTLPVICRAAGMDQPLYTHTGGGMTGSARYKWEQENGIFDFDRKATPKLLASISNAKWDAMMWGPYFNDRSEYYSCWIDFCLKYNPEMRFYLSDAWPQLYQLGKNPTSESAITANVLERMGAERRQTYQEQVSTLLRDYPNRVFIMPTSDAMVLAGKAYLKGELPGIEGIHRVIGGKERSLWRDQLGHLGPGFEWLEGYVFYATLYRKSPELIQGDVIPKSNRNFPSTKLDEQFRKIAWEAVTNHHLSGVKDSNGDGIAD